LNAEHGVKAAPGLKKTKMAMYIIVSELRYSHQVYFEKK